MKTTKAGKALANEMKIKFLGVSENERLARICVAGFIMDLRVSAQELADVKTSVSEAVTNSIVHGYKNRRGYVTLCAKLFGTDELYISVSDDGCGIEDVEKARQPLFTTDPGSERCGMGFPIMESFMDKVKIYSRPGKGTKVIMIKKLGCDLAVKDGSAAVKRGKK